MALIDSHAHLTFPELHGQFEAILERSAEAGVDQIITIGVNLSDARAAIALAERHPQTIRAAVGFHPQPPPGPDLEPGITYVTVAVGIRSINWGGIFNDLMTKPLQVPAPVGVPQAKLDALTKRVAQLEAALQEVIGAKPR